MAEECVFCAVIAGRVEASVVVEDETVVVWMDLNPVTHGHLGVVPRTHAEGLEDLDRATSAHVWSVGQDLARAMRRSDLGCRGINLVVCDGVAAFQTVFHFHLHVIPRYPGDGVGNPSRSRPVNAGSQPLRPEPSRGTPPRRGVMRAMARIVRTVVAVPLLGALALVSLAACGPAGEEEAAPRAEQSATASAPSPPEAEGDDPCELLTAEAAEELAGEPMAEVDRTDVGGMPACRMSGATRWIQVAQVPATDWAATVPGLIDQVRAAGGLGEENLARLDDVAARLAAGEYDGMAACDLFSTMAEFNGTPPGSSRTVAYVPDALEPQAISAQACADGTYTSLLLAGTGIAVSAELEAAVVATLDLLGAG